MIGAIDVVRHVESLLGYADGEDEVGAGDNHLGNGVVIECPVDNCALGDVVEDGGPIVGGPSAGVECEVSFALLC